MKRFLIPLTITIFVSLMTLAPVFSMAQQVEGSSDAAGSGGFSEAEMGIVAVVNDEPISAFDLSARLDLILSTTEVQNPAEARRRLVPQVLQTLISEKLQLQEAERLGIEASIEEMQRAFSIIEQRNNLTPGDIERQLAANSIPISTLRQQVRSSIVWRKAVQRRAGPLAQISEDEVEERLNFLKSAQQIDMIRYGEIFLPIDSIDQEQQVLTSASELFEQLKSGVPFPELARQFSQKPSADEGGDSGWTPVADLEPEVRDAVESIEPGYLTEPYRLSNGYSLFLVIDRDVLDRSTAELPTRDMIATELGREKLMRVARKYSSDLRRDAVVQMRIAPATASVSSPEPSGPGAL